MADLRTSPGPHVFVEDLDVPLLDDDDRHHLAKALRLRSGDAITISDAAGRWRTARFGPAVEPTGPIEEVASFGPELVLGFALTKAAKPEFAVQKATEIGMDRVMVFESDHSVVTWDATKRGKNLERLRRVAREAAMQSRRVTIPEVTVVATLDDLFAVVQAAGLPAPVRADFGGVTIGPEHGFVLVGPEGGWSNAERNRIPIAVDLGPTVLRAETASVVACSLLVTSRGRSD